MAEFFESLSAEQAAFIRRQPVFFVATAAEGARVNVSPKGMDAFRVLGPNRVGYLDVGGSGNETQAHLAIDGRITVMFCAFDQPALIMRLYGRGAVVLPQDPDWARVVGDFTQLPGTRQIFLIDVESVQTSCGWGVPVMTFDRERETLSRFHAVQDPEERLNQIAGRNRSIDGLPVRVQTVMPWAKVAAGPNSTSSRSARRGYMKDDQNPQTPGAAPCPMLNPPMPTPIRSSIWERSNASPDTAPTVTRMTADRSMGRS